MKRSTAEGKLIHPVELAVFQAPQNVFDLVGAPSEIRGIPSKEIALPIGKQFRIIGSSPASGNGVAFEIDIDMALLALG
jgi:hypothetical protein